MDPAITIALASLITAIGVLITAYAHKISVVSARSASRANTAIDFLLRRGKSEAARKGYLLPDDTVDPKILEVYSPFFGRLKQLRATASQMCDSELFVAIEDAMGDEISQTVCPALNVYEAACVYLAMCYVRNYKNGNSLDGPP